MPSRFGLSSRPATDPNALRRDPSVPRLPRAPLRDLSGSFKSSYKGSMRFNAQRLQYPLIKECVRAPLRVPTRDSMRFRV